MEEVELVLADAVELAEVEEVELVLLEAEGDAAEDAAEEDGLPLDEDDATALIDVDDEVL